MGLVTLRIDADSAKAVSEFMKLTDAQQKVENQAKKMSLEMTRGATASEAGLTKMLGPLKEIAGALGIGMGIGAGVANIVEQMEKWKTHLTEIAKLTRTVGDASKGFALMQPPGTAAQRLEEVHRLGAKYGVKPSASPGVVQEFQQRTGNYETALRAGGAAMNLSDAAGMPLAAAVQGMQAGMEAGLDPDAAMRLVFAAQQGADVSPEELEAALKTLRNARGPLAQMQRRAGVKPGATPMERIQALNRKGMTSFEALTGAGVPKREAMTVARMAANATRMQELAAPGAMEDMSDRVERDVPQIGFADRIEKQEAERELLRLYGPNAERARRLEEAGRAIGLGYERRGRGDLTDEEGRVDPDKWHWRQGIANTPGPLSAIYGLLYPSVPAGGDSAAEDLRAAGALLQRGAGKLSRDRVPRMPPSRSE